MNDREKLFKLLHQALLEIRESTFYEITNNKVFKLSNLLHTLPLELASASSPEDHQKIFSRLYERASKKGLHQWIDNVLSE